MMAIAENMKQMMHFLCDSLNKSQGTPPKSIKHPIYIKSLIHYGPERKKGWVKREGMEWMKWNCEPETRVQTPLSVCTELPEGDRYTINLK